MSGPAFIHNEIVWWVDPNKQFSHINPKTLAEGAGLIPTFINENADDIVEEALLQYGFGGPPMEGGTVADDGTYKYPQDPDLHPICKAELNNGETIYIYSYGIVAFVSDERTIMYRFD